MPPRKPPGSNPKIDDEKYPKVFRAGPVAVEVYRSIQRHRNKETGEIVREYWLYTVDYTLNGKRERHSTTDPAKAHRKAREKVDEIEKGHIASRTLTGSELDAYSKAEKLLSEEGLSLDAAIRDYIAAYRIVKPISLVQIARQHSEHASKPINPKTIQEILPEFNAAHAKFSERHRQTLTNDLARFARAFSGRLIDVNAADLDAWLLGLRVTDRNGREKPGARLVGERTRRNIYGSASNFFHWAQRKNYLPRERPTEIDYVDKPGKAPHIPQSFTAEELRKLLEAAPARLIPIICLCAIAGIRRGELERLDWEDVRWAHDDIQIWADASKTKTRRLPPLLPNCKAWIESFRALTGPVCPHPDRFNQMTALAKSLGLSWPHDILRDSFISNRAAILRDLPKVAYEAGNSQRMIEESYLKRVTEREAKEYFDVAPKPGWKPRDFEEISQPSSPATIKTASPSGK